MNVGEEICGEWLRHIKGCEFIQYNVKTPDEHGEIDVVGISLRERRVYACEVAVHLVVGLQYVKANRPNNVAKLTEKISKDIRYIRKGFKDYDHVLMLWSPVVRDQRKGAKENQLRDVATIRERIQREHGVEVVLVINEKFAEALAALRQVAARETQDLKSPVMRFLQVEEYSKKHLVRLARSQNSPR